MKTNKYLLALIAFLCVSVAGGIGLAYNVVSPQVYIGIVTLGFFAVLWIVFGAFVPWGKGVLPVDALVKEYVKSDDQAVSEAVGLLSIPNYYIGMAVIGCIALLAGVFADMPLPWRLATLAFGIIILPLIYYRWRTRAKAIIKIQNTSPRNFNTQSKAILTFGVCSVAAAYALEWLGVSGSVLLACSLLVGCVGGFIYYVYRNL